jgi:DNA-binding CsgD family transcriptional regulator
MAKVCRLTEREIEVAEHVVAGKLPAWIACALGIGVAEVEANLASLFAKTSCDTRGQFAAAWTDLACEEWPETLEELRAQMYALTLERNRLRDRVHELETMVRNLHG